MCFRPPNVKKPIKCPKCGALNPGTNKECSKCNADLTKEQESSASGKEV
ncbi:zinc-ribbon domain-containing protein [Candidatus Formimonas warabiya]|nr:zinc-ribbon domain-containing protein [Candidatus Formimonas warabiya]